MHDMYVGVIERIMELQSKLVNDADGVGPIA